MGYRPSPRAGRRFFRTASALLAALILLPPPASAQLRLPPLPTADPLRSLPLPSAAATATAAVDLSRARALDVRELLRRERRWIEADPAGEPVVRGELLGFAPSADSLAIVASEGLELLRRRSLGELGGEIVVWSVPRGQSIHRLLRRVRQADPGGVYDYNHLYMRGGLEREVSVRETEPSAATRATTAPVRVGLVDSGVEASHPALRDATLLTWGCEGTPLPESHGTAVASLLAGHEADFHGAAPGATVYAADVYCGRPTGGAVETIAAAFGWLVGQRVPVINVSLVGPANAMLAAVVARAIAHGYVIVAAVGNDGPAAAPLYPAAYPGVIGVTAVDARERVLLEANRGPQVAFAARGADLVAARIGAGYAQVRGTSFAAPIVAGLLAARCSQLGCADEAVRELAQGAKDLGAPGRDPIYGHGLVGTDLGVGSKH